MTAVRHVRQEEPTGCAVAVLAMLLGRTYAEVVAAFGPPGAEGYDYTLWAKIAADEGYAVQQVWRGDWRTNAWRDPWPLAPWADVHVLACDIGRGNGSHLVVLLRDGTVLDPWHEHPRRLEDLRPGGVDYMAAVYRVPGRPPV